MSIIITLPETPHEYLMLVEIWAMNLCGSGGGGAGSDIGPGLGNGGVGGARAGAGAGGVGLESWDWQGWGWSWAAAGRPGQNPGLWDSESYRLSCVDYRGNRSWEGGTATNTEKDA